MFSREGDTALVLLVPEVEPIVGRWRAAHDPSAAEGMPAHVTVLYPFVPHDQLGGSVHGAIARMCRAGEPLRIRFAACGQFPGVLWLDPDSSACRELLVAARDRWPQCPPYGKKGLDAIPHLTITDGASADTMDDARRDVLSKLPIDASVRQLSLMAFDGATWVVRAQYALGAVAVEEGSSRGRGRGSDPSPNAEH